MAEKRELIGEAGEEEAKKQYKESNKLPFFQEQFYGGYRKRGQEREVISFVSKFCGRKELPKARKQEEERQ